jgi:metacaspase-1
MANNNYEAQIQQAIPAEFHMISGSHDSQTSADVSNVGKFQLPNPAGRAGGACTSALLQVLYRDGHATATNLSWVELLRQMRSELLKMGFDQVPQLTSSRLIDVNKTMYIVPPGSHGRRRAVLIGINYGACRFAGLCVKEGVQLTSAVFASSNAA